MRIADILAEPQESSSPTNDSNREKDMRSFCLFTSTDSGSTSKRSTPSLKRVVSKLLVSVKKNKEKKRKSKLGCWGVGFCGNETEKKDGACGSSSSSSLSTIGRVSSSAEEEETTFDGHGKNPNGNATGNDNVHKSSLNFVAGAAAIFLFAKAAEEYSKMIKLRKEVEKLFKETQENRQQSKREDDPKSCLSERSAVDGSFSDDCITFPIQQSRRGEMNRIITAETPMECGAEHLNYDVEMNLWESEVESEMERWKMNSEIEDSSRNLFREDEEMPYDHYDSWRRTEEEDEDIIEEEQEWDHNCGVCPLELERRLHELLEARQQERIQELEAAMREAERELLKKEMEIHWWRNIVHFPQNKISRSR